MIVLSATAVGMSDHEGSNQRRTPHNFDITCSNDTKRSVSRVTNGKDGDEVVQLSLRGTLFTARRDILNGFPNTRLGRLSQEDANFNADTGRYEFDRSPTCGFMDHLLDFYRDGGNMHLPTQLCHGAARTEMLFWDIPPELLAPCCYDKYEQGEEHERSLWHMREQLEKPVDRIKAQAALRGRKGKAVVGVMVSADGVKTGLEEEFKDSAVTLEARDKVWAFFEDPQSSKGALVWSIFVGLNIYISMLTTGLETLPGMRIWKNGTLFQEYLNLTEGKAFWLIMNTRPATSILVLDTISTLVLLFDATCHFSASRNKKLLLKTFTFLLQVLTTLAMLILVLARLFPHIVMSVNTGGTATTLLIYTGGILRLLRGFLFIRLTHSYRLLYILSLSIQKSWRELLLLVVALTIAMMIFSIAVFYSELTTGSFSDMFESYWWALVTMSTVGYGDITPKSIGGRVVGGTCVICGVIVIAIPVAVIGGNFTRYYSMVATVDSLNTQQAKRKEQQSPKQCWETSTN